MSKRSWAPEPTTAQQAAQIKPLTLFECGHGLSVAHMVGADTCNAADEYIRELEQKVADAEWWWFGELRLSVVGILIGATTEERWKELRAAREASDS